MRRSIPFALVASTSAVLLACSGAADSVPDETTIDGSVDASTQPNAPANDAAASDGVPPDGGADASPHDGTVPDGGTQRPDGSVLDATVGDGAACPSDMAMLPGFCMDRYEAPNQKGAKPLSFQIAPDGEAWCKTRGKRLCTEAEWVRACEGPNGSPYPYGTTYVKGRCNDDKTWISPNWTTLGTYPSDAAMSEAERLYQADPSGSNPECVSAEGVFDLTGNVAEWVERSFFHGTNYDQVMKGCYWSGCYGGSPPSCAFTNPAHPGTFRTYEAGFRCCTTR